MAKTIEYNRIKVVLAEKKKTNKELALHLKKNPETISRWCTNDSQPSIATLFEIASYLSVSVCELLINS